ncbi:MAG: hypothetical protein IKB23_04640 [Clostridia bacterium]|nr:hypothetical protein [Clostridia bacterium]
MAKHRFIELLSGYRTVGRDESVGGKHFISKAISGRMDKRSGHSFSSAVNGFTEWIEELVMYTVTRSYGFMALTFGILTVILHFAGDFFIESMNASITSIVIGAVTALLAVPLLFSREPLTIQLQDIPVLRWLLYDFFCLKRANRADDKKGIPTFVLVTLGVALAVVGFFFPVKYVAAGFLIAIYIFLAFQSPELSMIVTLIVLPYVMLLPYGQYVFVALVAVTVLSFIRKTVNGKRAFFLEVYDVIMLFLVITVVVSCLVMNAEPDFSIVLASVPYLGYLIGGNLTTDRRIADRAMSAIAISTVPADIKAIVRFITSASEGELLDAFMHRETSVFSSAMAFSVYLTVSAVFCIFFLIEKSEARPLFLFVLALDLVALFLAGCPIAVIVIALCFLAYRLQIKSKYGAVASLFLVAVTYLVYLLPDIALDYVMIGNESFVGKDIAMLKLDGINVFLDNILLGVGAGSESVTEELSQRGYFFSSDFGNIFIEIACESGIIALILFVGLLLVRTVHLKEYFLYLRSVRQLRYSVINSVAMFVIISLGIFCAVFSDPVLTFLMWFIFGMGSSILRISKREFDDRYVYFKDQSSFDSSEIIIGIRDI